MPEIITQNCLEGWQATCRLLYERNDLFNQIIKIENPAFLDPLWLTDYDPHLLGQKFDRIGNVINTIFPYRLEAKSQNRFSFYTEYYRLYNRAKRMSGNRRAWGTYFQRLTDYHLDGKINQLFDAIDKLSSWGVRSTTGLVFHLSNPALDNPRTRGGPCWHFGEILWLPNDRLDLLVVYRNHDYANKALGNFIALGKLLEFIANESGKRTGQLICHSAHAYFDCTKQQLRQLARL